MRNFLYFFGALILLSGCSQNKFWVAPKFTDVNKIGTLKKGMTKSEVAQSLGVDAFDAFYNDAGNEMFVYNYRLEERRVPVSNSGRYVNMDTAPLDRTVNSESAQNAGTVYYTDWRKLYITYQDDKLVNIITEGGMQDASTVLLLAASVQNLRTNPNVKVIPYQVTDENFVTPLDKNGQYISTSGQTGTTGTTGTPGANGIVYGGGHAEVAVIPQHRTYTEGEYEHRVEFNNRRRNKRWGFRQTGRGKIN